MSNYIHDFVSLPTKVQEVILSSLYEINKNNGYVDPNIGKNLVAQAVVMMRYSHPSVTIVPNPVNAKTDLAKPGAEETATQQVEAGSLNPDYVDPEIFDPKENNDALDALGFFLETLLGAAKPEQHCGRPECVACNAVFGELKPEFSYVKSLRGVDGELIVEQSNNVAEVYKLTHKDRSVVVGIPQINELNYFVGTQIVKKHGKCNK